MWNTTAVIVWVSDNAGLVFASTILVLCVGLVGGVMAWDRRASIKAYWEHRRTIRIQRGLVMGRKKNADRKAYLKGRWSDIITDAGETEWLEGRQTREEVNAFYRAIGKTHNMPDLVPVLTKEQLKSAIKGRKSHGGGCTAGPAQEHPMDGGRPATASASAPAATPSTAAVDDKTNIIQAAKAFGAKARARLLKTA